MGADPVTATIGSEAGQRARLAAWRPDAAEPFSLDLVVDDRGYESLNCFKVLRHLPGKRIACLAQWRGETVFAKLFLDARRARIHWRREEAGIRVLLSRGVLTPGLIHSGPAGEGVYVMLHAYLPGGRSAAEAWEGASERERLSLLTDLAMVLAGHHRAGLLQRDLHFGNFLLADGLIFTLDGDDISASAGPLHPRRALENLALLFAQLPPVYDRWIEQVFAHYLAACGGVLNLADGAALKRLTERKRQGRKRHFLEKTMRECSAFVCRKRRDAVTVYDRAYDSAALRALLADLDAHMAAGEMLKRGNTCTVARVGIEGTALVVKRYNLKSRRHALSRAFRTSRAAISWRNAHRLLFYGIPTPRPVALVEERWGPLRRRAYFIAEYAPGVDCLTYLQDASVSAEQKSAAARGVVELLRQLRTLRISHGDLKATNIRIGDDGVLLLDLDSMREHRLGATFARAWRRDMRRFMRNWDCVKPLRALFEDLLVGMIGPHDRGAPR